MPETLHPPYNVTQPRQLVRWLDVNSQNGPLSRCQTYITIPVFNAANTWNGYSDIVCAFNYTAPNNFSFTQVRGFAVPLNLPFLLCVSYVDSMDNVVRYTLNSNKNAVMFFDTVPYTNQMILKNFRIEVWSCNATAAMGNPVTLYTSVMQNVDTRLGKDLVLTGVSNEDTNFSNNYAGNTNVINPMYSYDDEQYGPLVTVDGHLIPGVSYVYSVGDSSYIRTTYQGNIAGNFIAGPNAGIDMFYYVPSSGQTGLPTANLTYSSNNWNLPLTFPNTINTNI